MDIVITFPISTSPLPSNNQHVTPIPVFDSHSFTIPISCTLVPANVSVQPIRSSLSGASASTDQSITSPVPTSLGSFPLPTAFSLPCSISNGHPMTTRSMHGIIKPIIPLRLFTSTQ